jgi:hypothetical protein
MRYCRLRVTQFGRLCLANNGGTEIKRTKEEKMKKTLTLTALVALFSAPALAANMENPLYAPKTGEIYTKTGAGLMYKKADHSDAMKQNGKAGGTEFPIWRGAFDAGYGITERLSVNGGIAWTQDDDIGRKGMNNGQLGLTYRILDGLDNEHGLIWDVYANAHLGGVMEMKGSYSSKGFKYDNYTNGRYGVYAGMKLGKTWDKFTFMGFAELQQTFGNHNNLIDLRTGKDEATKAAIAAGGAGNLKTACDAGNENACLAVAMLAITSQTDELSVNLKSTLEFNTGFRAFYELDEKWSFGGAFKFSTRENNGIKSVYTPLTGKASDAANELAAKMSDMQDGWDEYVFTLSAAYNLTEWTQLVGYAEYTFDASEAQSQNGTDIKAEVGARVNMAF